MLDAWCVTAPGLFRTFARVVCVSSWRCGPTILHYCCTIHRWHDVCTSMAYCSTNGMLFCIIFVHQILEAFDCQDFEDGSSYLKADYRISCDSDMYTFIYVSVALGFVYSHMALNVQRAGVRSTAGLKSNRFNVSNIAGKKAKPVQWKVNCFTSKSDYTHALGTRSH